MPHSIELPAILAGYAAKGARAGDANVEIQYTEFVSTEDGQHFIRCLEQLGNTILGLLAAQCKVIVKPSSVDNLLVIVNRNRTAAVWLNELPQVLTVRPARAIKAGEAVTKNDIVDVAKMDLGNITIPSDCGVVFLFSVGWRKGLFFDFGPLIPHAEIRRDVDCSALFAHLHARVLFQERFSILESEWESLFRARLFPFAGLKNEAIAAVLAHIRSGWDPTELSDQIVAEVRDKLSSFFEGWRKHPQFGLHMEVLERAGERFLANDCISCVNSLMPRIEGILRTHHFEIGRADKPTQSNLAESATASQVVSGGGLLLPEKFREYLTRAYFASFSQSTLPCAPEIALSRHSVAHGVAAPGAFTPVEAAISFLILHQLFYCFEPAAK